MCIDTVCGNVCSRENLQIRLPRDELHFSGFLDYTWFLFSISLLLSQSNAQVYESMDVPLKQGEKTPGFVSEKKKKNPKKKTVPVFLFTTVTLAYLNLHNCFHSLSHVWTILFSSFSFPASLHCTCL